MKFWKLLTLSVFAIQPTTLSAHSEVPASSERQLQGLSPLEASELIAKLSDAQERVRSGQFQSFELLSGSVATYEITKVSPRDVFLDLPFDQVWQIERLPSGGLPGQSFRLDYAPDGLGKPYWEIDTVVATSGNLERVTLVYRAPAPF